MSDDILFTPFKLKGLTLKNRFVMAPMTRGMAAGGIPGPANAEYYRRRAEGGVGLILTEGTVVNRPASRNIPDVPFFHGENALAGWADVAKTVHAAGSRIGPQLWHTGAIPVSNEFKPWESGGPAESPSGLIGPGAPHGVAMTEGDIADTVSAFAHAAMDAKRLGFDTLELHGAHGYLIDQFFWPGTNTRTDIFGGATIRERSRFATDVVRAIRAAIGPDFPLILRVSQWKQQDFGARLATTPQEMTDWLAPLVEAGVDILHCSQRRFWEPEFPEIDGPEGLNFAGWAKKLTGAATISVGSVGLDSDFFGSFSGAGSGAAALGSLQARMEREEFDLIAVGRVLISDPQWVRKVHAGETTELRGFIAEDMRTLI